MPAPDPHRATPRRRSWIRRLLLPVLFLVLGWAVLVLALQRRILFPRHVVTPAPEVGAHTEEVLLELGMSWEEIGRLKAEGAVL